MAISLSDHVGTTHRYFETIPAGSGDVGFESHSEYFPGKGWKEHVELKSLGFPQGFTFY
jgi:hypothetical protein